MKCTQEKCPIKDLIGEVNRCTIRDCTHRTLPEGEEAEVVDRWIEHIHFNDFGAPNGSNYECPKCHFDDVYDLEDYNFCPKCGKQLYPPEGCK